MITNKAVALLLLGSALNSLVWSAPLAAEIGTEPLQDPQDELSSIPPNVDHLVDNLATDDHEGHKLYNASNGDGEGIRVSILVIQNLAKGVPPQDVSEGAEYGREEDKGHRQLQVRIPQIRQIDRASVSRRRAKHEEAKLGEIHHPLTIILTFNKEQLGESKG